MGILSHLTTGSIAGLPPGIPISLMLLGLVLVIGPIIGGSVGGSSWVYRISAVGAGQALRGPFIAAYVTAGGEFRHFLTGFLPPLLVVVVAVGLILLEPDFAPKRGIFANAMIMLFGAGASLWHMSCALVPCLFADPDH